MQSDIESTVRTFTKLVLTSKKWDALEADDLQVFLGIVAEAGFSPQAIGRGKVVEKDGTIINQACPFKVVSNGEDNHFATGWLECIFKVVLMHPEETSRDGLVAVVRGEIIRSNSLKPIQLTRDGDVLREPLPSIVADSRLPYLVDHTMDDNKLFIGNVGIHDRCGGTLSRRPANEEYDVILCLACFLRVPVPNKIKTYGELRAWAERNPSDSEVEQLALYASNLS